jgi:hypothetical protein
MRYISHGCRPEGLNLDYCRGKLYIPMVETYDGKAC